jgi:exosome complex RNA-binding protein Csl4
MKMANKKTPAKAVIKTEVKPEPKPAKETKQELDGTNYERCKKCQVQVAVRLDTYTWRCPVCGDYEVR